MKHKILLISVAVMLVVGLVVGGCAKPTPAPAPKPVEPIEIVLSLAGPKSGFTYLSMKAAVDRIEEKAGGRVNFTWQIGGALLGHAETWEGVTAGVADIVNVIIGLCPGQFPLSGVLELCPGCSDAQKSARSSWILYEQYLQDEWKDAKVLYTVTGEGNTLMTAKKKIMSVDDLKGLRIRASALGLKAVERFGAVPVSTSTGEVYEALQRGVVDGCIIHDSGLVSLKLAEVVRYNHQIYVSQNCSFNVMNLEKYNSLPADIKALFDELGTWGSAESGKIFEAAGQEGRDALIAAGGEIITYSTGTRDQFIRLLMPLADEWVAELEAKGYPAREVLDARNRLMGIE